MQPAISRTFYITRSNSACGSGSRLTVQSNNDSQSFYRVTGATTSTTVTQVYASVLIPVSGLMFTTSTGNWSSVQQDTQTYPVNGGTYYRYYASLSKPVPAAANGVITLPVLNWTSNCTTTLNSPISVNGRGTATINGTQQIQVGAYRTM